MTPCQPFQARYRHAERGSAHSLAGANNHPKTIHISLLPSPGPSQERLTKQPKRPGTRPSPSRPSSPPLLPEGEGGGAVALPRWFTLGTKAKSRLEGVHSQLFQPEDVRHQNPFPRHDRQKMFVREAGSVEIGQHQAVVRENILSDATPVCSQTDFVPSAGRRYR